MCGRFALSFNGEELGEIVREEGFDVDDFEDGFDGGRYNVAPRTNIPILRRTDPSNQKLQFQLQRWGIQSHKLKKPDAAAAAKAINARDDTIMAGGMWAPIRGSKRGVLVCNGFYEWLTKGKEKLPYFVSRGRKPMFFTCLWDCVTFEGETEPTFTFAIVTTSSNKQLAFLHDRMPVVLQDANVVRQWLDTSSKSWNDDLVKLLRPYDGKESLSCYRVTQEVGKVGTNSSGYIKPLGERKGAITNYFVKQPSPSKSPSKGSECSKSPKSPSKKREVEGGEPSAKRPKLAVNSA